MRRFGARAIAGIGVVGSLASVVALVLSTSGGDGDPGFDPVPPPAPVIVLPPPPPPPPPSGPEPLRLPPVTGLLFSEARELLIREGWFPISSPANPTGNPDLQYGNGPYFVEQQYREVITCSGTGLAPCKFAYRSEAGQYLYVVTVGEDAQARVNDLWIADVPEQSP